MVYNEFVIKVFELNVIDYLLKFVNYKWLEIIVEWIRMNYMFRVFVENIEVYFFI